MDAGSHKRTHLSPHDPVPGHCCIIVQKFNRRSCDSNWVRKWDQNTASVVQEFDGVPLYATGRGEVLSEVCRLPRLRSKNARMGHSAGMKARA
jgi:hypothetical protein